MLNNIWDWDPVLVLMAITVALSVLLVTLVIKYYKGDRAMVALTGAVAISLAGVFFGFFSITGTQMRSSVLVNNDQTKIEALYPKGKQMWKFDPRLTDNKLIAYQARAETGMTFHPITENPKVRDLNYYVIVEQLSSSDQNGKWQKALLPFGMDSKKWLEYQLYDFNEQYSKEAAGFYNPLNETQQVEFFILLNTFLEPRLAEADARLLSARFALR